LIMTVLMGGIIAYNGDLIGRKYGKKRVTLFNLRPKHTAILITSVTGVLISAFTTAIVFLLVPPVRNVIMHGEEAIRDNRIYAKKNMILVTQTRDLENRRERLESQISDYEKRLTNLTNDYRSALKDRDTARKEVQVAKEQTREENRKLQVAQREKAKAENET